MKRLQNIQQTDKEISFFSIAKECDIVYSNKNYVILESILGGNYEL